MSEASVEIVRRCFASLVRAGDFDAEDLAPRFEFDNSNAMLDPAIYRGPEAMRTFMSLMGEMWEEFRFEPQEYLPVGVGQVVVPVRLIAVGRDGLETIARSAHLVTVRGGRVAHIKAFQTRDEALEAAGLRE